MNTITISDPIYCFIFVRQFQLLGFIFLAAGAFIRMGQEYYMPFVDGAVESLPSLMAGAGLSDGSTQPDDVSVDFNGTARERGRERERVT